MLKSRFTGRPLKVLILPSWYPPDGGWFFRDQAHFVAEAGVNVAVAYPRPVWPREVLRDPLRLERFTRGCEVVNDSGVLSVRRHWLGIPSRGRLDPWQTARAADRLFRDVVDRWGWPDLIHAHSTLWGGYAAAVLHKRWDVPFIITEHRGIFSLPAEEAAAHLLPWYRPYVSRALNNAECVLLVGSGLARQLRPLMDPGLPCEVLPNGVNTAFFAPGSTPPAEPFTFVFVGNLLAAKGVHDLVAAFEKVHRLSPHVRLIVVGDGRERAALEKAAFEAGISSCIEFIGQVNAVGVREALQRAHVLVLPSQFEAFGVSLIEAMAAGLPVIASHGVPPEAFPAFAGLRVPFGDAAALAAAMEQAMRHYDRFDRSRIREFAVETYDFRGIAKRLIDVYRRYAAVPHLDSPHPTLGSNSPSARAEHD